MASATTQEVQNLKNELKVWEKAFAATNEGRKPSRDNIKADADIAAKYKLYSTLTKPPRPQKPLKEHDTPSKKRKAESLPERTPQKRRSSDVATPRHSHPQANKDGNVDQENATLANDPFATAIGPTPHKDGKVLGLFDCLASITPSKTPRVALGDVSLNLAQTPSKRHELTIPASASPCKHSRTPQSSGKRFLLDSFVTTPSKRLCLSPSTPSSTKRLQTPSLLRRRTEGMVPIAEEASPQKIQPFKRRSFGRSLSSMIKDMKQQQERNLDEELDLLHEVEAGLQQPRNQTEKVAETQLEEFDEDALAALEEMERQEREANGEQPPAAQAGESQASQKIWKKKGLKRQTKRVIMRPVRTRPKADPTTTAAKGSQDDDESGSDASIHSDGDEWTSEPEADAPKAISKKSKKAADVKAKEPLSKRKAAGTINPNAVSHANFRSLKIKNKNSKGKGRGRFGRR